MIGGDSRHARWSDWWELAADVASECIIASPNSYDDLALRLGAQYYVAWLLRWTITPFEVSIACQSTSKMTLIPSALFTFSMILNHVYGSTVSSFYFYNNLKHYSGLHHCRIYFLRWSWVLPRSPVSVDHQNDSELSPVVYCCVIRPSTPTLNTVHCVQGFSLRHLTLKWPRTLSTGPSLGYLTYGLTLDQVQ